MDGLKEIWQRFKDYDKKPTKEAIVPGAALVGLLVLTGIFFYTLPVKQTFNGAVSQLPELGFTTAKYLGALGNRGLSLWFRYDESLNPQKAPEQLSSR